MLTCHVASRRLHAALGLPEVKARSWSDGELWRGQQFKFQQATLALPYTDQFPGVTGPDPSLKTFPNSRRDSRGGDEAHVDPWSCLGHSRAGRPLPPPPTMPSFPPQNLTNLPEKSSRESPPCQQTHQRGKGRVPESEVLATGVGRLRGGGKCPQSSLQTVLDTSAFIPPSRRS